MTKTNILYITSAERIGGLERVLLLILKNLNGDLFSSTVVLPEEEALFDELKKANAEIIKLKAIKKLNLLRMTYKICGLRLYNPLSMLINIVFISFYFVTSVVKISGILRSSNADILHIHSTDIAVRCFLATRFIKKPLILVVHDILKSNTENLFLRWLIDIPFTTICCSNAVRRSLLPWSKDIDRVKTIYNGVDLNFFNEQCDATQTELLRKNLNLKNLVVGIAGRFDLSKGHETFLEAASAVIDTMKDVSFIVVGSWALDFEKPRVEALKRYTKKLGLQDRVVFTGFAADVKKYYHLMDIVTVPSWEEPFGMVTVEALACRRPVIGTNSGGTPEIIEDGITGILVPPKDPDALAQAIIRLLRDEGLRKRLASEGRRMVEEFFNEPQFMREIEGVYKEAAKLN